jgi:hypothetical protein
MAIFHTLQKKSEAKTHSKREKVLNRWGKEMQIFYSFFFSYGDLKRNLYSVFMTQ